MKVLKFIVVLVLTLLIAGCNNSSNDSQDLNESTTQTTQEEVNPAGIWIGYQTILTEDGRGVFDMKTLIYNGKFYGVSEDANIFYSGSYEMVHGKYLTSNGLEDSNTSYKMYLISDNGEPFTRGVLSVVVDEKQSLSGSFVNDVLQEGEIKATFSKLYDKPSSLEYLQIEMSAKDFNVSIAKSGIFSGTKNNCNITGDITAPNSSQNIYKLNFTLSDCDDSGVYEGLGVIALDNNNSAYFVSYATNSDDSRMDTIAYYLDSTPDVFLDSVPKSRYSGGFSDVYTTNTDNDFSNLSLRNLEMYKSELTYTQYDTMHAHKHYKNSNFNNFSFSYFNFYHPDYYAAVADVYFEACDFSSARFNSSVALDDNWFDYSNFEGSNIDEYEFPEQTYDSDTRAFIYKDKYGNEIKPNSFQNAWWVDGRRCSMLGSWNKCDTSLIDTGLTYEEYKNGKGDIEKAAENIAKEAKEIVESVVGFVKDIVPHKCVNVPFVGRVCT